MLYGITTPRKPSMWVLLIITLFGSTYLEKYTTQSECESERVRITQALQDAYPGDESFKLICRANGSKV